MSKNEFQSKTNEVRHIKKSIINLVGEKIVVDILFILTGNDIIDDTNVVTAIEFIVRFIMPIILFCRWINLFFP